jgi:hypothetical protein
MKPLTTLLLIAALTASAGAFSVFAAPPRGEQPGVPHAGATSGQAAQVGPGGASVRPTGRLQAAPLTEGECKGLGGKVFNMAAGSTKCCDTGKACVTVDQDGVIHSTCITKE